MGHRVLLASALAGWAALSAATAADTTANGIDLVVDVKMDDFYRDQANATAAGLRAGFEQFGIHSQITVTPTGVSARIEEPSQRAQARAIAEAINQLPPGSQSKTYAIAMSGDGVITLTFVPSYRENDRQNWVRVERYVIARRLGISTRAVRIAGTRLSIHNVGRSDYWSALLVLFPPKLTLRMVADVAEGASLPDSAEWLELCPCNGAKPARIAIEKRVLIDGDRIRHAGWSNNPELGGVVVTAVLDDEGRQLFADLTKANIGKRLAVVMGDKVLTAPTIYEPILGGSLQIDGDFTVKTANDLATLIRAGSIQAPLTIVRCALLGDDGAWKPCPILNQL